MFIHQTRVPGLSGFVSIRAFWFWLFSYISILLYMYMFFNLIFVNLTNIYLFHLGKAFLYTYHFMNWLDRILNEHFLINKNPKKHLLNILHKRTHLQVLYMLHLILYNGRIAFWTNTILSFPFLKYYYPTFMLLNAFCGPKSYETHHDNSIL